MRLKIDDIARLANVSKATVSAVINEKSGVAAKTRKNVLDIIERFDYRPNHVARSLSKRATKSIGLVIKEIDNPFYTKIMRGVFDTCSQRGYSVFLGSSELLWEQEEKIIDVFVGQQVDGLIVTPLHGVTRDFKNILNLISRKFPLVTVGEIKNYKTNNVCIDNVQAARRAVSYLIERGHKHIAYFAGPENSLNSEQRLHGYEYALSDAGLPVQKKYVLRTGSNFDDGYSIGEHLFSKRGELPTAVFCYNDLLAIGLIQALQKLGFKIPEDIAVIGFDNIDFSRFANIPLTTVMNPARELGEKAAKLLLQQIENPAHSHPEQVVLDAPLIVRNSA
ncbi:MAG: LacI family DNA-binding transcriptional regulator [Deferribacteres bacterium]|nr:LacI family DNA-binding transcriptional regulator [candidate division KSB1 bacterium]MCB9501626.1 LacI family DNA-binding transcriptional regulator [Deferribacteres bacterium]